MLARQIVVDAELAKPLVFDLVQVDRDRFVLPRERRNWLADFEKVAFKDEVRPLILKENAIRLFGLA